MALAYTDRYWPTISIGRYSEHITIKGNHIFNAGGEGIVAAGWGQSNTFESNLIHDTGLNGVYLYCDSNVGFSSANVITNNHIHHTGQLRGDLNGIEVNRCSANTVSHNLIHDTPRASIHAGGSLADTPPSLNAADNVIAYNDVSRANTDSQDSGPIDVGSIPSVTITQNRIHDSDMPFSFGQGIYLDVATTQATVSKNLVHDLQQRVTEAIVYSGIEVKGDGAQILNNVVARNRLHTAGIQVVASDDNAPGFRTVNIAILRNILSENDVSNIYSFPTFAESQLGQVDSNLFQTESGTYGVSYAWDPLVGPDSNRETLEQWRAGHGQKYDQHSLVVDPRFVDPNHRDFRLRPDSPAYALGFEDIDYAAIGLTADFPFADTTESLDRLFVTTSRSGASATVRLARGEMTQVIVSGRTRTGYLVSPPLNAIAFSSDRPAIATVDALGNIMAGTTGLATITVTATVAGLAKSTVIYVAVTGSPTSVVEFYNADQDHYFISSLAADIQALDSGRFSGWARTGKTFNAWGSVGDAAPNASPVCRFYIPPAQGDSHFYSASPAECAQTQAKFPSFILEAPDVMYVDLPNPVTGACVPGDVPVYRVWDNRVDSNHRYTTDAAVRAQMVAKGWIAEGYGPDQVIMCAPQ